MVNCLKHVIFTEINRWVVKTMRWNLMVQVSEVGWHMKIDDDCFLLQPFRFVIYTVTVTCYHTYAIKECHYNTKYQIICKNDQACSNNHASRVGMSLCHASLFQHSWVVEFEVLTAVTLKNTVVWDWHHIVWKKCIMLPENVSMFWPNCMVSHPRRQY
jgi:hypothetical protein